MIQNILKRYAWQTRSAWRLSTFAILTSLLPRPAFADAWTPAAGASEVRVAVFAGAAEGGYDRAGEPLAGRFEKREVALGGAHGLSHRLAIVGELALQDAAMINVNGDARAGTGLGRAQLGLRYRLTPEGPWAVSVEGGAATRGAADTLFEVREEADAADEVGAYAGLALGRGFGDRSRGGWIEVAADARRIDAREETRLRAVLGLRPAPRIAISARLDEARWSGDASARKAALALAQRFGARADLEIAAWRALSGKNAYVEDGLAASLTLLY